MVKAFEIQYQGQKQAIQINDRPNAGVMMKISKMVSRQKPGQTMPEIDLDEYIIGLATNLITMAPWKVQDPDAIRALDYFETYQPLTEILGGLFPYEAFLSIQGNAMYGKKFKDMISQTESTSKPSSLDLASAR